MTMTAYLNSQGKYYLAAFQLRVIRNALFLHQNKKCFWCGNDMAEQNGTSKNINACTLDHFFDAWEIELRAQHRYSFVAACSRCNQERSRANEARQPIEILHERASRHKKRKSGTAQQ